MAQAAGLASVRERLCDEATETYREWRRACECIERAHADWGAARRGERRLAHAVLVAALDREERAAEAHRQAVLRKAARLGA